jgi:hypothetical protein
MPLKLKSMVDFELIKVSDIHHFSKLAVPQYIIVTIDMLFVFPS